MYRGKRVFSPYEYERNGRSNIGNNSSASSDKSPSESIVESSEDTENSVSLCAICNDIATGFHYKCMTCEGCKGFFRRTVQKNLDKKYKCKMGTNNCVINKQNRGRCQECRHAKCVKAGMVADLVLSNDKRKEKQLLMAENRKRKRYVSPLDLPMEYIDDYVDDDEYAAVPATAEFRRIVLKAYVDSYESSESFVPSEISSYWESVKHMNDYEMDTTHPIYTLTSDHLARNAKFIDAIADTRQMAASDRKLLLGCCGLQVFLFRVSVKMAASPKNNTQMKQLVEDVNKVNPLVGDVFDSIRWLMLTLVGLDLDEMENALFAAMLAFQRNDNLFNRKIVDPSKKFLDPKLVTKIHIESAYNIAEHLQSVHGKQRNVSNFMLATSSFAIHTNNVFGKKTLWNIDPDLPTSKDLLNLFSMPFH